MTLLSLLGTGLGLVGCAVVHAGQTLHVGPGQVFATPSAALAQARAGDTILVHPRVNDVPYERVALLIRLPNLTITALPDPAHPARRVELSGAGFEYSGVGSVPRAIIQFDPGSDGCTVEGFELLGAHNQSGNGAGVRINQSSRVTIRGCEIHANDMGVMSNGTGAPGSATSAANQRIERCLIHSNGDTANPGFSHNLYLGGHSVVLSGCEVRTSTSGHNVKSRAHYTRVEYSWVHDSANREFDLVDAAETEAHDSDAVLIGCIITKASPISGNRSVIHFGQDGGRRHEGTLYLVNNTITTPYISPVVDLSAAGATIFAVNNLVTDGGAGQGGQVLYSTRGGAAEHPIRGEHNVFSAGFPAPGPLGVRLTAPVRFADLARADARVTSATTQIRGRGSPMFTLRLPGMPGMGEDRPGDPFRRYLEPLSIKPRSDDQAPDIGAVELGPAQ